MRLPLPPVTGSLYGGAAVAHDVPLAPLTTLRVGPVARRLITCTTADQIVATLSALDGEPHLILAGGSNLLIDDGIADLTVVQVASPRISLHGNLIRAEAGAVWDDVVITAIAAGLGGLECLSGIPGSAGATPVQNVGAYGAEVADTLTRIQLFEGGATRWADAAELGFGYRTSILKRPGPVPVVLEVEFALDPSGLSAPIRYGELSRTVGVEPGQRAEPARVREAVLALRRGKGMVLDDADPDTWSAGSFFTNPVVTAQEFDQLQASVDGPVPHYPAGDAVKLAAGWLVEQAGFAKGYPGAEAPARLSTKHALALTNRGQARSADLVDLARRVRDGVWQRFGIRLEPEPVLVGCVI